MALDATCKAPVPGRNLVIVDRKGGPSQFRLSISAQHAKHVELYVVDDCLVKKGERCDHLLFPNESAAVFIELKGGDVEKGISQLTSSIRQFANDVNGRRLHAVLVPTRCPLPPYQLAKAQDAFRKALGCKLRVRNRVFEASSQDF